MRRLAILVTLGALLLGVGQAALATAAASAGARPLAATAETAQAAWTVALYVDADNNLDRAWTRYDAPELRRLAAGPGVNVVALVDRAGRTGVQLVRFAGGESQVVASYSERDMGSGSTLTWFLRQISSRYPSDHLLVDIWDHGDAWHGLCWDDSSRGDHLTMAELRASLVDAGVDIDVLTSDTCLTADLDVAYDVALTHRVRYLVASEDSIPVDGFAYDAMLAPLVAEPSQDAAQVVAAAIPSFLRYYLGIKASTDVTLSIVDVPRVLTMRADLRRWSAALRAALPTDGARIATDVAGCITAAFSWQVDAGAAAAALAADEAITSAELRAASAVVATDLDEAVVAVGSGSYSRLFTGLTVWWGTRSDWRDNAAAYSRESAFAAQTGWYDLLAALNRTAYALRPPRRLPSQPMYGLTDVVFTDSQRGYASGYGTAGGLPYAFLLRTGDGGATWDRMAASPQRDFAGVAVRSGQRPAAVGSTGWQNGVVLRSGDAGATWAAAKVPTWHHLLDIDFAGALGWVSGSDGTLYRSADAGRTWSRVAAAPRGRLTAIDLVDATHGWVVANDIVAPAGTVYATADAGVTFTPVAAAPGVELASVRAVDSLHVWVSGGDLAGGHGVILATSDGGLTWTQQLGGGSTPFIADVTMVDLADGWAVGDGGAVYRTTDGGVTWVPVDVGSGQDFTAVAFVDAAHGCIVGDGQTIVMTRDGGATWGRHGTPVAAPRAIQGSSLPSHGLSRP